MSQDFSLSADWTLVPRAGAQLKLTELISCLRCCFATFPGCSRPWIMLLAITGTPSSLRVGVCKIHQELVIAPCVIGYLI
jgi:hypothetical protein